MDIFGAILFLIFIVFPAVAIYSFSSRTVSGVYHWADRQHPNPIHTYEEQEVPTYISDIPKVTRSEERVTPPKVKSSDIIDDTVLGWRNTLTNVKQDSKQSKRVLKTPLDAKDKQLMEDYLGYDLGYEDSKEYQDFLDSQQFDVRAFLNDSNRK